MSTVSLQRGKTLANEYPGYDTNPLDNEAPVLELWGMWSTYLLLFIIQGFRTIVFIFIAIFTKFQPICPPAFFRCFLLNSGAYTEL